MSIPTIDQARLDQFGREDYNRVPIVREVMADLDTPLSTYLKLGKQPLSYLLESVQGGEKWGRYSIIGLPCRHFLRISGHDVEIGCDGQVTDSFTCEDPLAVVAEYQSRFRCPELDDMPRFHGGLVGYFGYDTVRYVEKRLQHTQPTDDAIGTPDIYLMVSDELVVFDNLSGKLLLMHHCDPADPEALAKAEDRLDELERRLREPLPDHSLHVGQATQAVEDDFRSASTREGYEAGVEKIREYIKAGDIMQAVLSQRMSVEFKAEPINLYRALRCLNPSPYMYYLDFGDFHIVGSSPEILTRLEEGIVTVRPIAGTRPRGANEAEDQALEKELLADPKELAEHLMLIDLGRNDVGRVADISSVKLTEKMVIERYSHVMHIVSNVIGKLKQGMSALDVLAATLPAGTLSGAPKVRAMEIIDELEPVKRGIYGGAIGYLSWQGNMDTAIAIRTAVIKNDMLYVQAGAGIVADSVPATEWEETLNKGRAVIRAVALAQRGL
ncbi:anthranilate synthase component I [Allohahella marinimesophila]|uniref:Anthranilate synthase component 1 n=1 Tax=Allohahella marinimesophila TaxID=1054972 RepID=A0ABP7PIQ6_9GAMM